ncbi:ATPase [Sporosarcina sp.]|uniref:ATPase n=1 Tax=Sporosarcina sp. TaxID=49982 RepID=UPI002609DC0C|nr:ATPase [Sporosarcina sp.]
MTNFLIPGIITLVVTLILSIAFKGSAKVDKGTKFNYFTLSYRRKMIRNITSLPLFILALIFIFTYSGWSTSVNIIFGLAVLIIYIIQLLYNYYMWKRHEA